MLMFPFKYIVAVAWEKSSYTVDNDASDVSVCVVVYSTTSFRNVTLTVQVLSVEGNIFHICRKCSLSDTILLVQMILHFLL